MLSAIAFAASVLVAFASAQTQTTSATASSTESQSMPAAATSGFNAANVSSATAQSWCIAQLNTCPEICGGSVSNNYCSSTSFTYSCICANGTEVDCTAYENTLPYFMCQATYDQCIADHPNDLDGQTTCKNNEQCGTLNASALDTTSSSSSSSTTTSASSSATSSTSATASATASSTSSSSSSAANIFRPEIATGAFVGLLFVVFLCFL